MYPRGDGSGTHGRTDHPRCCLALTLLVIGCPGALVISISVAIVAGIGRAARNGILIKGGQYLEIFGKISAVAADKTGTLTEGRPQLTDVMVVEPVMTDTDVLAVAASAEAGSEHPLARPIVDAAKYGAAPEKFPQRITPVVGKGIVAEVNETQILIGSPALLEQYGVTANTAATRIATEFASAGKTPMIVAVTEP